MTPDQEFQEVVSQFTGDDLERMADRPIGDVMFDVLLSRQASQFDPEALWGSQMKEEE